MSVENWYCINFSTEIVSFRKCLSTIANSDELTVQKYSITVAKCPEYSGVKKFTIILIFPCTIIGYVYKLLIVF